MGRMSKRGRKVTQEVLDDLSKPEAGKVKRVPVDFDYSALNPGFIKGLARIAGYAAGKYGSALQYTNARLVGEKSPINHAKEHIDLYVCGKPHDRFGSPKWHLVAAAYNLGMEYFYFEKWGHVPHPLVVEEKG
jgi:hypothetical protein